jgi:hypothetical protein
MAGGPPASATGQINESGDDYIVFNFTNTGVGNAYHPRVTLTNDGGGIYRMQVMNSGCTTNANNCGGTLTAWEANYPADPNFCIENFNCSDLTPRVTTVVVRVFRPSAGPSCALYTVTAVE